ncbi:MAG: ATP-binding cassette domain-containing protein [Marinicella sp.]|nr:ABC transporter ATP-binding protein [Xanthomonadales bacterium]
MSSIKIKNVNFSYRYYSSLGFGLFKRNSKVNKNAALENVNLDIQDGDRVALFGRNGAGKSTLLKIMSGVIPPSSGKVQVDGKIYSFFGRDVGVNPFLSGFENLYVRGLVLGLPKKTIEEKLVEIAEFTELGENLKLPVSTYSQGMKARLTFAMLMFVDADVLLVDEGLGAGDRFFIDKARAFVDQLLDNSKILIFASHSDHLLKRFCNKGILLKEGKIISFGEFDEVCKQYQTGNY